MQSGVVLLLAAGRGSRADTGRGNDWDGLCNGRRFRVVGVCELLDSPFRRDEDVLRPTWAITVWLASSLTSQGQSPRKRTWQREPEFNNGARAAPRKTASGHMSTGRMERPRSLCAAATGAVRRVLRRRDGGQKAVTFHVLSASKGRVFRSLCAHNPAIRRAVARGADATHSMTPPWR